MSQKRNQDIDADEVHKRSTKKDTSARSKTSSMSGKLEYLEKYSVAPSPSRDYYGLKVSDGQVTLYLWRISHGPHKTPIVQTSGFADFKQDQRLQDEIRRIFGEYLIKHVKNIISGRNTILTLPKSVIERLIKYLTVEDIIKLSSLSHISKEIFDNNFVWEALYKKYKPLRRNKYEELRFTVCNWKELFQLTQISELTDDQKMLRTRANTRQSKPTSKIENPTKTNLKIENLTKLNLKIENPIKVSNSISKVASKTVFSDNQITKKSAEMPRKKNTQMSISKKLSDNRLNETVIEKEKVVPEKRTPAIKSLQLTGQKNLKSMKDQSMVTKFDSKREFGNKEAVNNKIADAKANKIQNKVKRVERKASGASVKATEEKLSNMKSRNAATSKMNKIERPLPRSMQGDQGKPKGKGKTKKVGQSKSTILRTNTDLLSDNCGVKDDSFDLADLIEASLKNIRSPRSIFDYNFSCIDKPKSCDGDAKAQDVARKMADHPRALRNDQLKASLDRLSEKSEPLTGKSTSSTKNDTLHQSVSPKLAKALNAELKKSTESNKNRYKMTVPEEKAEHFERYGIYNKYPTPRTQDSGEQKKPTLRKDVDKMHFLRSLGPKASQGRTGNSSVPAETNRYELRKSINNVYKYL
ncbi:unnamed protein product [Xylocopa violacea]|uniref:F-box domain-containing protein n=1 Tax=Xylocopa violacea TaxID=135666 RepID=A0ABP1NUP9_XYLVO